MGGPVDVGPVVLLVDDDQGIRLTVRAALEASGFQVEEAGDGDEALEKFDQTAPDVVLLDILMPRRDGYEVCGVLRAKPQGQHVPVVMMTGLDDQDSIQRAYDAGATDFVLKPINYTILVYRMNYVLRAKRTADDLRRNEALLADAQRIARIGYWEWDPALHTLHASSTIAEIIGQDQINPFTDVASFLAIVHPGDRSTVTGVVDQSAGEIEDYSLEYRIVRADRAERVVAHECEVRRGEDGSVRSIVCTVQDITERRRSEERIRYLATYDELTGLPNRSLLNEHIKHAIGAADLHQRSVVVVLLDLDHFKRFNETLGFRAGDQLLKYVAQRLRRCLRVSEHLSRDIGSESLSGLGTERSDVVARLGGDEFAVLLTDVHQVEDAVFVAKRIKDALARPFIVDREELYITASLGISAYPIDGVDPETLMNQAEVAMNHAKERGRDRYQFFKESLNARTKKRFSIETQLRKALERDELVLYFQPKIDLQRGCVVGAEALVRWNSPDLGMVPPLEFIPIAEDTGMILPLGEWIMHEACAQTVRWHEAGMGELSVAINLSAVQFRQRRIVEQIDDTLKRTGLAPRLVELELTESLLLEDTESSIATMSRLKGLGCALSVDDFGTGYSSLSYLKRLPIDTLKVDQSFVRGLHCDADDATIVNAIIALGHSLGLKVVAEGVEHLQQLRFLEERACDEIQGMYFSGPLAPDDFSAWFAKFEARRADEAPVLRLSAG